MSRVHSRGGERTITQHGGVERRRGRRANVQVPLRIRRVDTAKPEDFREQVASNVSLAGAYFEAAEGHPYTVNDLVMAAVTVPEGQRREFPFTRLAGRGRVVRIHELGGKAPDGRKRYGVALEFGEDLTALTAIPSRG